RATDLRPFPTRRSSDLGALGAEHVLLPPHLAQVAAGDRAPLRARRLDLRELDDTGLRGDAIRRREVQTVGSGVEERVARRDAEVLLHPGGDLGFPPATVVREGVAREAAAVPLLVDDGLHRSLGRELRDIRCRDAAAAGAEPGDAVG